MDEIVKASETPVESYQLVALNPQQMAEAQVRLRGWLQGKLVSERANLAEVTAAHDVAKKQKWATAALRNQMRKAERSVIFYEKVLAAVEMGYTIVPNFPLDIFAVRVWRKHPHAPYRRDKHIYDWRPSFPVLSPEHTDASPLGVGSYVSPNQRVQHGQGEYKNNEQKLVKWASTAATDFKDVAFPIIATKPEVLEATAEAMKANIFDQIGICHDKVGRGPVARKGDPLIVGQIIEHAPVADRWDHRSQGKTTSFLIAWHLDLRTI